MVLDDIGCTNATKGFNAVEKPDTLHPSIYGRSNVSSFNLSLPNDDPVPVDVQRDIFAEASKS